MDHGEIAIETVHEGIGIAFGETVTETELEVLLEIEKDHDRIEVAEMGLELEIGIGKVLVVIVILVLVGELLEVNDPIIEVTGVSDLNVGIAATLGEAIVEIIVTLNAVNATEKVVVGVVSLITVERIVILVLRVVSHEGEDSTVRTVISEVKEAVVGTLEEKIKTLEEVSARKDRHVTLEDPEGENEVKEIGIEITATLETRKQLQTIGENNPCF